MKGQARAWLRRVMGPAGFTSQGELATAAELSRETVNNIYNGKVIPDEETLAKLARACGVDTPSIVFDEAGRGPVNVKEWILEAEFCLQEAKSRLEALAAAARKLAADRDDRAAADVIVEILTDAKGKKGGRRRKGGEG